MSAVSPSVPRNSRGVVALSHTAGDAAVVVLRGCLQEASRHTLERPMAEALLRGHRHLVLDLHELRAADADGIWVLSDAVRRAIRRGARISIVGLRATLEGRVDHLADDGVAFQPTVRSAIAAVPETPKTPTAIR